MSKNKKNENILSKYGINFDQNDFNNFINNNSKYKNISIYYQLIMYCLYQGEYTEAYKSIKKTIPHTKQSVKGCKGDFWKSDLVVFYLYNCETKIFDLFIVHNFEYETLYDFYQSRDCVYLNCDTIKKFQPVIMNIIHTIILWKYILKFYLV